MVADLVRSRGAFGAWRVVGGGEEPPPCHAGLGQPDLLAEPDDLVGVGCGVLPCSLLVDLLALKLFTLPPTTP